MDDQIKEKVKTILEVFLPDKTFSCDNEDEDISELLDSILLVSLIVEIEDKFGFEINENDFSIMNFSSVQKITNLIKNNLTT